MSDGVWKQIGQTLAGLAEVGRYTITHAPEIVFGPLIEEAAFQNGLDELRRITRLPCGELRNGIRWRMMCGLAWRSAMQEATERALAGKPMVWEEPDEADA